MLARSMVTDFASLLNPADDSTPNSTTLERRDIQQDHHGGDMASLLRPNGPLPGGQMAEAQGELPRPYKCPLCEKAFHRLEHQTRHIRTHTGEKPHACQFPGCSKKFSRSDELTRHSRIHNNANSRRSKGQAQPQHVAMMNGMQADMFMPPVPKTIRSAPPSGMSSPNVSPPHSLNSFAFPVAGHVPPYNRSAAGSQSGVDMTFLNRTAEREVHAPRHHLYYPGNHVARGLPGLSAYHMTPLRPFPGDHHDDHYSNSHRHAKRSRPNSPSSTAPSSPTFSLGSLSPTPDHTPLMTPAHSPRLRPFGFDLPPVRNFALQHTPALPPLEPQPEAQFPHQLLPAPGQQRPGGISLSDIITRPDGAQRKLPVPQVPKVAVHDLLGPSDGFNASTRTSSSTSLYNGEAFDASSLTRRHEGMTEL